MTSDVEGARRFYSELFGWEAGEPSSEFGGYFMFLRNGVPVAGAMDPGSAMPAANVWETYLATDDLDKTVAMAEAAGAQVVAPAMPIADLGIQGIFTDPTGALIGAWQAGTFPGFTVVGEHGAPSWFELWTNDHAASVAFYREIFRWETNAVADTDEFRYTTRTDPTGDEALDLAGIMDASAFLPAGAPPAWSVYWEVDDVAATLAKVKELGGSVVADAESTPYGVLATAADPAGAQFKLRAAPAQ